MRPLASRTSRPSRKTPLRPSINDLRQRPRPTRCLERLLVFQRLRLAGRCRSLRGFHLVGGRLVISRRFRGAAVDQALPGMVVQGALEFAGCAFGVIKQKNDLLQSGAIELEMPWCSLPPTACTPMG